MSYETEIDVITAVHIILLLKSNNLIFTFVLYSLQNVILLLLRSKNSLLASVALYKKNDDLSLVDRPFVQIWVGPRFHVTDFHLIF